MGIISRRERAPRRSPLGPRGVLARVSFRPLPPSRLPRPQVPAGAGDQIRTTAASLSDHSGRDQSRASEVAAAGGTVNSVLSPSPLPGNRAPGIPTAPPDDPDPPRVYVISVCDGVGTVFQAVSLLSQRVDGYACESQYHLGCVARGHYPRVRRATVLKDFSFDAISPHLEECDPDFVFLFMGPPCPPHATSNVAKKTFADERSSPLTDFRRLRDSVSQYCVSRDLVFRWAVEESALMSSEHRQEFTTKLGCPPVLLHAADFGWVHKARLFWGLSPEQLVAPRPPGCAHIEIVPPGRAGFDVRVVRWSGPPAPRERSPRDGWSWRFRHGVGRQGRQRQAQRLRPRTL